MSSHVNFHVDSGVSLASIISKPTHDDDAAPSGLDRSAFSDANYSMESASDFLTATSGRLAAHDLLTTGHALVLDQSMAFSQLIKQPTLADAADRKMATGPSAERKLATGPSDSPLHTQSSVLVDILNTSGSKKHDEDSLDKSLITSGGGSGVSVRGDGINMYSLMWKDLNVRATSSQTLLLRNVSGFIAGGLHACMSSSGGGKTTLLNTLSYRLDKNLQLESGTILLNGQPFNASKLKHTAAYIMQDDLLNGNLTVYETLNYAAFLKMPTTTSAEEKEARVVEVMEMMGLTRIRDVIVGTPDRKGISGGERKRLCVGQAIIARPRIIFGDEVTSGLDSVSAYHLISLFRVLTRKEGVTILTTIHQPNSTIFRLFDGLILMKRGEVIYTGSIPGALRVFESFGHPCEKFTNPADHLLDVLAQSQELEGANADGLSLDDRFIRAQKKKIADILDKQEQLIEANQAKWKEMSDSEERAIVNKLSWWQQFRILCHRTMKEQIHLINSFYTALALSLIMATLIGTVFLRLDHSQPTVSRRSAVLFFCCVNQGMFGSLTVINSFPTERVITLRERASGMYKVSAYFLAKSLIESIPQIIVPMIFSVLVYFVIGLQPVAGNFFMFMFFMVLCSLSAVSMALMVSCICKTASLSLVVLPMTLELSRLFGGFFLSPLALPNYFSWLDALSYLKYSYVGVSLNEFTDISFNCPATGACAFHTGQDQIKALGLDYITIGGCIGSLCAYIVGTRIIAYLAIRYIK